jgi:hypothetical protein
MDREAITVSPGTMREISRVGKVGVQDRVRDGSAIIAEHTPATEVVYSPIMGGHVLLD